MARRIIVRESMAQGPAELANDNAVQISRCFSALRTGDGFSMIADPGLRLNVGSPQDWYSDDSIPMFYVRTSEDCGSSTA
jgi:hypothetical protein